MPRRPLCALVLGALALALSAGPADACSIPVFRYALERWQPAPYEVVVFHKGPLGDDARALAARFEGPKTPVNVAFTAVDLDGKPDEEHLKLWGAQPKGATLPWLVVRYPDAGEKDPPLRACPFTEANVATLLGSPLRRQMAEALTQGETAVFLVVESGDPKADAAALELLDKELARLQKTAKLPEKSDEGPQLRYAVPVKVSFKVLRLSRRDAAEADLLRQVLGSEEGLAAARGPIVCPVFGRGRLLCALHGDEIGPEQLGRVATFLCGACSCRVKELNPGVDLLLAADWTALLEAAEKRGR
jgi:hypothetical protein